MMTWTRVALGLGVLGLTVGGAVLAGDPLVPCRPSNTNVIQNIGNGRSTTVIVEPGRDGQLQRSVFIQGGTPVPQPLTPQPAPLPLLPQQGPAVVPEPMPAQPQPLEPEPMPAVPAVPALPVQPVEPMPVQPMPVQPALPHDTQDLILRIPVPRLPEVPGVRMPVLPEIRVPAVGAQQYQVPANRTMVFNGPSGRTIVSNRGSNSTVIVGNGGDTTIVGGDGLCYRGKDNRFWTRSMYSADAGCTVYYDPRTTLWFRYDGRTDTFRVAPEVDD